MPDELEPASPNRLVGQVDPMLGQKLLHVTVARREPEIETDRVPDDLGWEAMAVIRD
jgi:hypothetical protein